MLLSLIVYIGTGFLLYLLATNYVRRNSYDVKHYNQSLPFASFEIIISLLLFALVAGLRYNTGVDYLSYLEDYLQISHGGEPYHDYEPIFMGIMRLLAHNRIHYSVFFAFCAFLQLFFVYYALKDYRYLLPYVGLYIMLGPLFMIWMNGIRQCIVVCFFLFLSNRILKKDVIWYVIGIVIASYIHKSALFLLPLFLIVYVPAKWFYNSKNNLLILVSCIILGMSPLWLEHITILQSLFEKIGYVSYGLEIDRLVSEENLEATAMGPGRIMLLLLDVMLILLYPKVSAFYKSRFIDQSFIIYFLGTCVYNLLVNTSHLFLRPVTYLTVFILVVLPATLVYLKSNKHKWQFYFISGFAYIYVVYAVVRAWYLEGVNSTSLYHFFFM
ncbi:MAG: EpsG family protein [Bacteroidales bacterium]|nr:EpsG family protein [Bacteroidales bacterium]